MKEREENREEQGGKEKYVRKY